ncbi:AMP-binding protein [Methylococcus sp. EFPC2]|uniref:AMP-binding protein n=1 Tax=Methylococcus sp. EFPC2 TaxID=2812648 RepID=UPI0019685ADE|nr:AMP-binding protein [Methylococcus sp. EFPC2]QSA96530.1 AMP-binding protein [Methylococcus sp. EFPC2]
MFANNNPRLAPTSFPLSSHQPLAIYEPASRLAIDTGQFRPIHALIEVQVKRTPQATAISIDGGSLTYRELNLRSNRLANYLRALGVGKDAKVAVCMTSSLELVVAMIAVLKAGGTVLPVDPALPPAYMAKMFDAAQAVFILTLSRHLGEIPKTRVRILPLDTRWSKVAGMSPVNPQSQVKAHHLAMVSLVSEAHSVPSFVTHSHGVLIRQLQWLQSHHGLISDDTLLQAVPYSRSAYLWELACSLATGGRVYLMQDDEHADMTELAPLVMREAVTTLNVLPSTLQRFLREPFASRCTKLRRVICSGGLVLPALRNACLSRLSAHLHELSDLSESTLEVPDKSSLWSCELSPRTQ